MVSRSDTTNLHPPAADAGLLQGRLTSDFGLSRSFTTVNAILPGLSAQAKNEADKGDAFVRRGQFSEALGRFAQAVRLQPTSDEYHFKLACSAWDAWEHVLVEPHLLRAASLAPRHPLPRKMLTQWYAFQGKTAEAMIQSAAALALRPGDPDFIVMRAYALAAGDQAEAGLKLLKPLMSGTTVTETVTRCYANIAVKLGHESQALNLINRTLADPALTQKQRSQLHFSATTLLDHSGQYDEAFDHAKPANELSRQGYNPASNSRNTSAFIEYFTKERLQTLPKATHGNQRPVLIVGMPRSGTSLVEQILACHPAIHGAGELSRLSEIMSPPATAPWCQGRPYPQCFDVMSLQIANQVAANYVSLIQTLNASATYVTDKMPQNFTYLGTAELLLPGCRVIHCIRDARDTCLSNYLTDFMIGQEFSHDLSHLAGYYRDYVRLMEHWKKVLTLPILDVRYEDLVSDQEGQSRRMLDFLNLPWDETCLSFHKSKRPVSTASRCQVRKPIYSSSIGRWKHYEKHIPELMSLANAQW